ncbi:MAG: thiamine phosphate synthase, partial [Candidatus Margulisiibacteriota bacterium]
KAKAIMFANFEEKGKIFRILDVNFNRATEGVRVVEEICRFILEDKSLTLALKKFRGDLSKIIKSLAYRKEKYQVLGRFYKERKALEDVGSQLYTVEESKRLDLEEIFHANMKRGQEAIRCLEEFSKIINPIFGKKFKDLRFKLYELEKIITPKISKAAKLDFDLYVITDPQRDHLEVIRRSLRGGVKIVQLRDKSISKSAYARLAKKALAVVKKYGAVLILNDYWDLVNEVGADGVHLGQEDIASLPIARIRKRMGEEKIIGISTHSLTQAIRAERQGADYISVGPIFSTPSKPKSKPVGIELLRKVLKRAKIPVVAIGGVDQKNIEKIAKVGCLRVAIIRAVVAQKNVEAAVKGLRKKLSSKG